MEQNKKKILLVIVILIFGVTIAKLWAFDHGPHFDLIRDALSAEGFSNTAIEVVQVANWFPDFYEQASLNPYSGHCSKPELEFLAGAWDDREHWPIEIIYVADSLHFDHGLNSVELLEMEWNRLARITKAIAKEMARTNDVEGFLLILGTSLHAVQDFYAHSNWVELTGVNGYDGPDWFARGYGSHPTWYDIRSEYHRLNNIKLYAAGSIREHGSWESDGNQNLATATNKDWPGRPCYKDAYITAYFATRQWIRAVRNWINNQSFWQKACQFNNRHDNHLDHDLQGAYGIEFYLGHWQGQGEPYSSEVDHPGPGGGNWIDLLDVLDDYHEEDPGKTFFRNRWEQIVLHPAFKKPPFSETPVQSTRDMQSITDFICVKINRVRDATSSSDIDPGIDEADFYTTANIAGQEFHSGNIHGYDTFDFPTPNYPFTFIKALPKGWQTDEPVTTFQIEVSTANMSYAGTDDEVFFRINDNTRFLLDKPLYDDFEKGDIDTYSLNPPEGLRICDIQYIQIEKASDGAGGGWKLGGIKVFVNRQPFYQNNDIHQWLQDNNLTWRALDFYQQAATTNEIPITLRLYDDDRGFLDWYADNDHCDIHPDYDRYNLNLLYDMYRQNFRGDITGSYRGNSLGGSLLGGGGSDDDEAEIAFSIEHFSVTPPPLNTGILESSYASSSHEVPDECNLYKNYPNPFNSTTLIQYEFPNETKVVLKIYNIIGQEVLTLVNEHQTAGFKSVVWDGKDKFGQSVNSGVYLYTLQAGVEVKSRRMIYQK